MIRILAARGFRNYGDCTKTCTKEKLALANRKGLTREKLRNLCSHACSKHQGSSNKAGREVSKQLKNMRTLLGTTVGAQIFRAATRYHNSPPPCTETTLRHAPWFEIGAGSLLVAGLWTLAQNTPPGRVLWLASLAASTAGPLLD